MVLLGTLIAIATLFAWSPLRKFAPAESVPLLVAVGFAIIVLFQWERLA
jgi:hypothetical protein